jgi:hypothetical protein
MNRSGSRERLHGNAANAQQEDSASTSPSLAPTLPLLQGKEEVQEIVETSQDDNLWVENAMKLCPSTTVKARKSTGSPTAPAGSSSSSSSAAGNGQATALDIAAELIRRGDISLSAASHSTSGTLSNLLPSHVGNTTASNEPYLPVGERKERKELRC